MSKITALRFSIIMPLLLAVNSMAQEPGLQEHFWVRGITNTDVSAAIIDTATNTLYVAGTNGMFFWPPTSTASGAVLDLDEGWPTLTGSPSGGNVWCTVADGSGGWFIGGRFNAVNGIARQGLARLNADGSLNEAWDPGGVLGGSFPTVYAMAIKDGILYIGGDFTSAGGAARYRVAAFDIAQGVVTSWNQGNSSNDGVVRAIVATDAAIYVGGSFTSMGGQARIRLAALDPLTGAALSGWLASANGDVLCLADGGDRIYAGGEFTQVNGTSRNRLAALDAASGSTTAWNPGANSYVHALALGGDTVFVGGEFTVVGGSNRSKLAALRADIDVNNAFAWDPTVTGASVRSIQVAPDVVYVGGQFSSVGSTPIERSAVAAFDRSTGAATNWNPGTSSQPVYALAYDGTAVYAGGGFQAIGERVRPGVAAFDLSTGKPTTWSAQVNSGAGGWVRALALKGDTLFMGGVFSSVNGVARQNMAAVNKFTGEVLAWEVITDDYVFDMAIEGQRMFLGGSFTAVNGVPRVGLAAINIPSATVVNSWQADCAGGLAEAYHVQVQDGRLFVSGWFTTVDGAPRQALAVLNTATGDLDPWQAAISPISVETMLAAGQRVFTKDITSLVALDATTGALDPAWSCSCAGMAPFEVGGDVLYVQGLSPNVLRAYSLFDALPQAWQSDVAGINDLHRAGDYLVAVGSFNTVDGSTRRGLAVWVVPEEFEDLSTSIPDKEAVSTVVFPIPTTGTFTVNWNPADAVSSFTVHDRFGRLIRPAQRVLGSPQTTVDLSGAAEGLYWVRSIGKGGTRSHPVVLLAR